MDRPSFKEVCWACLRLMKSRITIAATVLLVLALTGGDPLSDHLLGRASVVQAWQGFTDNVTQLLNHPLVRLALIFVALWLFGYAAVRLAAETSKANQRLLAAQDNARTAEAIAHQEALDGVKELLSDAGKLSNLLAERLITERRENALSNALAQAEAEIVGIRGELNALRGGAQPRTNHLQDVLDHKYRDASQALSLAGSAAGIQINSPPLSQPTPPSDSGIHFLRGGSEEFFKLHTENLTKLTELVETLRTAEAAIRQEQRLVDAAIHSEVERIYGPSLF